MFSMIKALLLPTIVGSNMKIAKNKFVQSGLIPQHQGRFYPIARFNPDGSSPIGYAQMITHIGSSLLHVITTLLPRT